MIALTMDTLSVNSLRYPSVLMKSDIDIWEHKVLESIRKGDSARSMKDDNLLIEIASIIETKNIELSEIGRASSLIASIRASIHIRCPVCMEDVSNFGNLNPDKSLDGMKLDCDHLIHDCCFAKLRTVRTSNHCVHASYALRSRDRELLSKHVKKCMFCQKGILFTKLCPICRKEHSVSRDILKKVST